MKNKQITLPKIVFRLIPIVFKGCPILLTSCILIGIMHGLSMAFNTYASQLFFDSVTKAAAQKSGILTVVQMAAFLGAVMLATQILNGVHNFMGDAFFKKAEGFLGNRINEKSSKIDPVSYESPTLLDDINKANQGMENSLYLLFISTTLFTFYLPYFLFMGMYLFRLKPILAFSLVLIFIPVALTQLIRGAVFAKVEDASAPIRREYEYYERCICDREYFKETRILGAFGFFKDLYRGSLKLLGKKTWDAEVKTGLIELSMKMLTLLGYFGILYLLFTALLNNEISVGAFAAVFASIDGMFSIMREVICMHIGKMTQNIGTVRNFIRFLGLPERQGEDIKINAYDGVVLKNVSFRYPGAKSDSLTDISFELKKGETIAVVGENGAGKTTFVKLLMGLYLPTKGITEVGGVDISKVSQSSVYNGISAVFQKFQKYKMNLDENIRISNTQDQSNSKSDGLQSAVLKADLDVEKGSFPDGFDTMLSKEFDGVDLSGGQWQRVAIARGFYRAHGMIVLDEPTAAIDPIEETKIYNKFADISKGKTSVIVTHRLGSARIADRIVVLDKGKIIGIGTHDELMNAGGKYAEMFDAQAKWYVS